MIRVGARGRMAVTVVALLLLAGGAAAVGAYGPRWATPGAARCLPAPVQASPQTVAPGGTLSVSSPAADCSLGYGRGHAYTVTLLHREQSTPPVRAAVAEDGSFRTTLTVPATFPLGAAVVVVRGSPMDDCEDTGSCVGYTAPVIVR